MSSLEEEIKIAERNITSPPDFRTAQYWIDKEQQLRTEKQQLRTEKQQLRTKEESLLKLATPETNSISTLIFLFDTYNADLSYDLVTLAWLS